MLTAFASCNQRTCSRHIEVLTFVLPLPVWRAFTGGSSALGLGWAVLPQAATGWPYCVHWPGPRLQVAVIMFCGLYFFFLEEFPSTLQRHEGYFLAFAHIWGLSKQQGAARHSSQSFDPVFAKAPDSKFEGNKGGQWVLVDSLQFHKEQPKAVSWM